MWMVAPVLVPTSSGLGVGPLGANWKSYFCRSTASATVASSVANWSPTHLRERMGWHMRRKRERGHKTGIRRTRKHVKKRRYDERDHQSVLIRVKERWRKNCPVIIISKHFHYHHIKALTCEVPRRKECRRNRRQFRWGTVALSRVLGQTLSKTGLLRGF